MNIIGKEIGSRKGRILQGYIVIQHRQLMTRKTAHIINYNHPTKMLNGKLHHKRNENPTVPFQYIK